MTQPALTITHFAAIPESENAHAGLFAVLSDQTVWILGLTPEAVWRRTPNIPGTQPTPNATSDS